MMTQMLTDTLNREQQTTRKVHVSGVLFFFLRLPTFLLPPQKKCLIANYVQKNANVHGMAPYGILCSFRDLSSYRE